MERQQIVSASILTKPPVSATKPSRVPCNTFCHLLQKLSWTKVSNSIAAAVVLPIREQSYKSQTKLPRFEGCIKSGSTESNRYLTTRSPTPFLSSSTAVSVWLYPALSPLLVVALSVLCCMAYPAALHLVPVVPRHAFAHGWTTPPYHFLPIVATHRGPQHYPYAEHEREAFRGYLGGLKHPVVVYKTMDEFIFWSAWSQIFLPAIVPSITRWISRSLFVRCPPQSGDAF